MLFNSYAFIFLFLPLTLLLFFALARTSHVLAAGWLAAASLFFYGWWNPAYVVLLMLSIGFNYLAGMHIARAMTDARSQHGKWLTILAVAANLLLLGYYKYSNFFLANAASVMGFTPPQADIILPLGISFFTFTQIAFLVDTYRGKVKEYRFVHYCLFVTYFPHLIAGPILHHAEMMPQFARDTTYHLGRRQRIGQLAMQRHRAGTKTHQCRGRRHVQCLHVPGVINHADSPIEPDQHRAYAVRVMTFDELGFAGDH